MKFFAAISLFVLLFMPLRAQDAPSSAPLQRPSVLAQEVSTPPAAPQEQQDWRKLNYGAAYTMAVALVVLLMSKYQ